VEKIFKRYDLRAEEKQAIELLAERGGKVFEAEIFEELGLPRTSTWRMVRRLAGMGIVEVRKYREQNLVCVRKRYILKN
ncbi:MAG: helix-turn-helix domain-containing protein, partial [Candidatus Bathyarchaeia archaeon]